MPPRPTQKTIYALRQTLAQVEEHSGLAPDDVCLIELKRILLNRIVTLESAECEANPAPGSPPHRSLPNRHGNEPPILAGFNIAAPLAEQPAVAVAVDLAITLLTDYLSGRPVEPVELAAPTRNGSRSHSSTEHR